MSDLKPAAPFGKLPLRHAIGWIALSVFIITGSCALGLLYYSHTRAVQRHDPANHIVALVQTSPEAEGLRTAYLVELLGLSVDHPTNIYSFDTSSARLSLLQSPVIKEASVRKIRPGTIHVDYTLRKPIAFLANYMNAALDAEGIVLPIKPFFTPKRLPEIVIGFDESADKEQQPPLVWGEALKGKSLDLAFALLDILSHQCCDELSSLCRIDVSKAYAPSYGQRQVVIVLEDRIPRLIEGRPLQNTYPRIIRLMPDNYQQQLANYLVLRTHLRQQDKMSVEAAAMPSDGSFRAKATIIDMRLSQLAFISSE